MATTLMKDVYTCSFWGFTFCLAFFWIPVQGDHQLTSSSSPVVSAPGEDVVLPCRLDSEVDAQDWTVEWSRPDVAPGRWDGRRRVDVVYLYRVRVEVRDIMMLSYIGRTSLLPDGLKHGDMSLQIRNVTLEDGGSYRCFTPTLGRGAAVRLVVDPDYVKTPTTETPPRLTTPEPRDESLGNGARSRSAVLASVLLVLLVLLVLGSLAVASFFDRRRKENKGDAAVSLCPVAALC
ncbi:butyrophilin-like protein 10 isoform 1-T2 [Odontesthes bonariensis]|uniref:butyrophilin-like protein 10 n=1 Tax=Odontesthes bonariensis TaxID=219752 RepID=UPI003F58F4C9